MGTLTLGAAIRTLLLADSGVTNIVSTRIFPKSVPQGTRLPYGVYQIDDQENMHHMTANSGEARVQITLEWYGLSSDQIETLATASRGALDSLPGTVTSGSDTLSVKQLYCMHESDDTLTPVNDSQGVIYIKRQEFSAWHPI